MRPLYNFLLGLYPAAYRGEYGEEMLAVLYEVQTEIQKRGPLGQIVSSGWEVAGLLFGALREHLRVITGSAPRAIFFPRRFTMRSEFRFPKAVVTLMAVILLAIFLAIDKAKAIQASIPYANPQVGPIHPTQQLMLLPTLLLVLAGACVTAALGWGILFALHRSGVHRFTDVDASSRPRSSRSLLI